MPYNYYYDTNSEILLFQNIGAEIIASNPISRFTRIDAGLDFNHIIKSKILIFRDQNNPQYFDEEIGHLKSFSTLIPSIKYIWDNALWSYTYPIDGIRMFVKYKTSPGINEKSLHFHSTTLDFRNYQKLFNGISGAIRIFAGHNWGKDAQKFRLGGVPWLFSSDSYNERYYQGENSDLTLEGLYFSEYVMPLRGAQVSNKYGKNVILSNIELRLPFLIYYFPAIKYLGQINGVVFADIGVSWDNHYPQFWDKSSWETLDINGNIRNNGWLMSYGFGPRFIFLGFPWQLDYAWEYNPHKGTISDRQWYLTIGLDF